MEGAAPERDWLAQGPRRVHGRGEIQTKAQSLSPELGSSPGYVNLRPGLPELSCSRTQLPPANSKAIEEVSGWLWWVGCLLSLWKYALGPKSILSVSPINIQRGAFKVPLLYSEKLLCTKGCQCHLLLPPAAAAAAAPSAACPAISENPLALQSQVWGSMGGGKRMTKIG